MLQGTQFQSSSRRTAARGLLGLLLVSALLSLSVSALAQERTLTVNVAGFTAPDWPQAQTVVAVLDRDGRSVSGLTTADFSASLNDSPVSVASVTRGVDSSLPISVVLALDISGSMAGGALDQAKAAAHSFLGGLGPQDSVAVFAFSDKVALVQPFTQDRAGTGAAIDTLAAGGETALYQATSESMRLAGGAASGRRVVVLLSDGLDNGSSISRADALAVAETLGVPVFAIGLGADIDRGYLGELAQKTGGQFAETPSPEGLAQLYQHVGELLRGQYVLVLDGSALALDQSEPATLRVNVNAGGQQGSAERDVCPQRLCVALSDLTEGERLAAERTVTARVIAADPVASVTFLVDGKEVSKLTEPPYQLTLNPAGFSAGKHTLSAQASTVAGETAVRGVTVSTGAAGGAGFPTKLIAIAVVLLAAAGGLILILRLARRRRGGEEGPAPAPPPRPPLGFPAGQGPDWPRLEEEPPLPPPATSPGALGRLEAVNGPLVGQTFPVGDAPASIGSSHRSLIILPTQTEEGLEIASEHARVWIRDGQLVVHELRRLTAVGSVGGTWEILAPGEVFSLGSHTFSFELGAEDKADKAGESDSSRDVPNILKTPSAGTAPSPASGAVPGVSAAQAAPSILRTPATGDTPAQPSAAPASTAGKPSVPNILRSASERAGEGAEANAARAADDGGRQPGDISPHSERPPQTAPQDTRPEPESGAPSSSDANGEREKTA